ncbi:MAG: NADPH:quinone reductase [Fuerstiella sp.]|nr:NADPH:quinone reductase [Fuerstiella sp.]MCP4508905.1 NADPH:quinone reductase [Fuerstiella sp.]
MKAAFIDDTGPVTNICVGSVDVPAVQPRQVLVRTGAVAVNPIDTYVRSGNVKLELPARYIVGCDIAGTVESVGADVSGFSVGQRVWGSNQGLFGRQGTFAEFAAIDQCWLYPTPDGVGDEDAAAGALTGITAHLGLHLHGGLQQGEVVFVNGGTGGVGSAVVQLARAAGATVVTTVGSELKRQTALQLGADHVINYREEDAATAISNFVAEHRPVNLWFETLRSPSPDVTIPLLAKRGRYVLMAGRDARPEFPVGPFYVNDLRAIGFAMFNASAEEQRMAADDLNSLMADGQLRPLIGKRLSLDDAASAHQLQEENTLMGAGTLSGKIVLTP